MSRADGRPVVQIDQDGKKQLYVSNPFCNVLSSPDVFFQSAEELSSMVLTKMRQTAEQYLSKKVKYVLSCPFSFFRLFMLV